MTIYNNNKSSLKIIAIIFVIGILIGGFSVYYIFNQKISDLKNEILTLKSQLTFKQSNYQNYQSNTTYYNYFLTENVSLSGLYEAVKDSVVLIRAIVPSELVGQYYVAQGSGFVYNYSGQMVIITNYHVVHNAINISVTFSNGNGYPAEVLGSDPYVDLAVLSVDAPKDEFKPLEIVSSSNLRVGEIVIAIGNPFGLTGSMSIGIISGLGRTIREDITGGYPIANVIQITAPINPGNSGGPLLNIRGQVIGITTAIIGEAQGVGFAIPSNTILREIDALIKEGKYDRHPWLGIMCIDMTYELSQIMKVDITYGCLIIEVIKDGPAYKAGLRGGTKEAIINGQRILLGGDIIIAINGVKIKNIDDLASYLEEYTFPGQIINVTVVRNNKIFTFQVELSARPPLTLP